jgi:hypothetical protein
LHRRLRKCTTRLLQVAWQKHKAACSWGCKASKQLPFWTIYEAGLVLSVWNAKRLNGLKIKFQKSPRSNISFEEFLAKVEAIAHPGKSSLMKKHQLFSLSLDSDAIRPSVAPESSPPVFLWQRWQVAAVSIALAILALLPILLLKLAGCTINFGLHHRSCHSFPAPSIWLQTH